MVAFWQPLLGYEVPAPPPPHATWRDWYLSVGVPEKEITVSSKVKTVEEGVAVVAATARQGSGRVVRNGEARVRVPRA